MIRESAVDKALNRLSGRFPHDVVVNPPASAAALAQLEQTVGPLPRDLLIFLATCDGLNVRLQRAARAEHLCGVPEMLAALGEAPPPTNMVPVRGDKGGAMDWVVTEPGPAQHFVVRWDPTARGAELLATSFGHFLDAWVSHVIDRATPISGRPRIEFDSGFTQRYDPDLASVANHADVRQWVRELDFAVASGDDFE